jgi:predicted permease
MDFREYVRSHVPPLAIAREQEVVEELSQHLDDLYREARAEGLDHEEAWARATEGLSAAAEDLAPAIRAASRLLPARIADRLRAALEEPPPPSSGALTLLTDLRHDVRYAFRMLARAPGFTAVVVATLALGIGATAVIFSAVDAVLLRSAPVAQPHLVVSVYTASTDSTVRFATSSYPDYVDLRDSGALEGLAAFGAVSLSLDTQGTTEAVDGEVVSGNYFDVLGVRIALGRGFRPDEDRPGSPVRVAVLSHAIWQQRFAGDPRIVGRTLTLNGHAYTVIGVAPRGFSGPTLGRAAEVWVPLAVQQEVRPPSAGVRRALGTANLLGARDVGWLSMVGRLRDGGTVSEAATSFDVVSRRLATAYPDSNRDRRTTVVPLGEGPGVRASVRPLLTLLGVAVTLVLLIACANVAGLLLARAVSRRREVAVRIAIGAGHGRLARQWLAESLVLGLLGAAGGLLLAIWGVPLLHGFGIPESIDLRVSGGVLAFTATVGLVSSVLFGSASVVQMLGHAATIALRDEGASVVAGLHGTKMRSAFVVLQVALSVILLVCAGLFLRSLQQAYAVDLGYRVERTLLADINLDSSGYSPDAGAALYRQLLERLDALPGVEAAAAARVTVLSGNARTTSVSTDGRPVAPGGANRMAVRSNVISDRYLEALGIPLSSGRPFRVSDDERSPRVAIVSRSLADRLWPNANPIGGQLVVGATPFEVVGVAPNSVYGSAVERNPPPFFYLSLGQNYESGVTLHVRTAGDPLSMLSAVRNVVRDLDPRLTVGRPRRLADEFDRSVGDQRMMAVLVGLFSGLALLLAAVGLYGVMAYAVRQRTTEIGLRLALGATPASILALVVRTGSRLIAVGAALGLAGAFFSVRFVRNRLFGIQPTDPLTWLAVSGVLVVVGAIACAIPARRAMRVDPAVALRGSGV